MGWDGGVEGMGGRATGGGRCAFILTFFLGRAPYASCRALDTIIGGRDRSGDGWGEGG